MKKRFVFLLAISAATIQAAGAISQEAKDYLDAALKIMQENFVYLDKIDWEQFKRETFFRAAEAQTSIETYSAIRFALTKLGDRHSFLQLTPELTRKETSLGAKPAPPSSPPAGDHAKPANPFPSPFRSRRVPEGAMVVPRQAPSRRS